MNQWQRVAKSTMLDAGPAEFASDDGSPNPAATSWRASSLQLTSNIVLERE